MRGEMRHMGEERYNSGVDEVLLIPGNQKDWV
jgi:hypothetical protein